MKEDKKAIWEKMKASNAVAVVSVACTFIVIAMLFFIEIPSSNKEIFTSIISFVMGTLLSGAVFYLFGYDGGTKKNDNSAFDNFDLGEPSCPRCGRSVNSQLPGEDTPSEDEEEEPIN